MKKIYFFIAFLFCLGTSSQTLTQAFNEPVIGDIDKNFRIDTSAYTTGLPLNVTGNNCVWNFTKLFGIYPLVIDSFVAPNTVPSATAFPATNYVQHRDVQYSFFKSTSSPQQTELLGATSGTLTLTFTNSAVIASYPVSYGYSLTDPVSGTFKYNANNGACNGSITITADGVGTVNLSGISIPNVIRLKSVEILTLSTGIFPFGTFNQTIYNYYMPGKKFPILNIGYTTYQLLAGTPTITALMYGSDLYFNTLGIKESNLDKDDYLVYPNPFHDCLEINEKGKSMDNSYLFYNLSGQLVLQTKTLEDDKIRNLDPGIYFIEIKNKEGILRQKIIKE